MIEEEHQLKKRRGVGPNPDSLGDVGVKGQLLASENHPESHDHDFNFALMDNDTVANTTIASSRQTQKCMGSPLSLGSAAMGGDHFDRKLLSPMDEIPSGKKRKRAIDSFEMSESDLAASETIVSRLKELYVKKLLPIERKWGLEAFCLPNGGEVDAAEFDARPIVLVLGQYSTGKVRRF